jgi:hypothetical protein
MSTQAVPEAGPQPVERGPDCEHPIRKRDHRSCGGCSRTICADHAFFRVDESNAAITRSSRPHCRDCADWIEQRAHHVPQLVTEASR